jgi:hypothetical protein
MQKKLLIIAGPQGTCNHAWAKIFSYHPDVSGWKSLLFHDWLPHSEEPMFRYWQDPAALEADFFETRCTVTSISVPYMQEGNLYVPNIEGLLERCSKIGVAVSCAIVTREPNIVSYQQKRVRKDCSLPKALPVLEKLLHLGSHVLSYEALLLLGVDYLRYLERLLDWPIAYPGIGKYITDENRKYVRPLIELTERDKEARRVSGI